MELLTKKIEAQFESQGYTGEREGHEIKIIVHWFNPVGAGDWYAYEREDEDCFWCFTNLNDPINSECGLISMTEMKSIKFFGGALGIERDLHWDQDTTLEQIRDKIKSQI